MELRILPLVVMRISFSLISGSSLGFSIFSYLSMIVLLPAVWGSVRNNVP
jgi:hypothetical protein